MHLDYEISEQDFINGQRLALKNSKARFARWPRLWMPLMGVMMTVFLINVVRTQGFSVRVLPGLAVALFFLFIPLQTKRAQKKLYAKSSLHGKMSLDVKVDRLEFEGPTFSSKVTWDHFGRFFEDDKSFVLYQKNERLFNIVPKRGLTTDQIAEFHRYLEDHLGSKGKGN